MPRRRSAKLTVQVAAIVFAALTMLGAGTPSTRFDHLGHQLMCTCGCAEILLECNHMGCPDSPGLIAELHNQIAAGLSDKGVLNWFAQQHGAIVLAAPIRGGFDLVAWIVPFAVIFLGGAGILLLVRLWKQRHAEMAGAQTAASASLAANVDLRDRIRRETHFEP